MERKDERNGKLMIWMYVSEEQATGVERFELLGDLMGVDVWDLGPLEMNRMGTMDDPIPVRTTVSYSSPLRSRVVEADLITYHLVIASNCLSYLAIIQQLIPSTTSLLRSFAQWL
jgi:hypothetical protein